MLAGKFILPSMAYGVLFLAKCDLLFTFEFIWKTCFEGLFSLFDLRGWYGSESALMFSA